MNILLMIKSDLDNITIETCHTRMEFFACMFNMVLPNTIIKNSSQKVNNLQNIDHVVFINETGFYYENKNLINNFKQISKTGVSTLAISNKYFTTENLMFGITKNVSNPKYIYSLPPLSSDIYINRQTSSIMIHFDICKDLYDVALVKFCESIKNLNLDVDIIFCSLNTKMGNYYDIDLNLIETIVFDTYIDYINEISKANMFIVTNICNDIYRLYEYCMCNVLIISNGTFIPSNIIDELDVYCYDNIDDVCWSDVFDKMNSCHIRDIMSGYNWDNYVNVMMDNIKKLDVVDVCVGCKITNKSLNIDNYNKNNVIVKNDKIEDKNVMDKVYDILDVKEVKQVVPKRKMLLQSQILSM